MPCNCCSTGLEEIFDDRVARKEARRFRRKGLPARSAKLVRGIHESATLTGAATLEVGAGIGAITITLLRDGAASASIIDAVAPYVVTAGQLAAEYGVADRLNIELADYASVHHGEADTDIVVMDRVVCCHPRWRELLEPATRQARVLIALTYPRAAWWTRFGVGVINFFQKLCRQTFRVFVHSPDAMHDALREGGFSPRVIGHHGTWEIMIAKRTTATGAVN